MNDITIESQARRQHDPTTVGLPGEQDVIVPESKPTKAPPALPPVLISKEFDLNFRRYQILLAVEFALVSVAVAAVLIYVGIHSNWEFA